MAIVVVHSSLQIILHHFTQLPTRKENKNNLFQTKLHEPSVTSETLGWGLLICFIRLFTARGKCFKSDFLNRSWERKRKVLSTGSGAVFSWGLQKSKIKVCYNLPSGKTGPAANHWLFLGFSCLFFEK